MPDWNKRIDDGAGDAGGVLRGLLRGLLLVLQHLGCLGLLARGPRALKAALKTVEGEKTALEELYVFLRFAGL